MTVKETINFLDITRAKFNTLMKYEYLDIFRPFKKGTMRLYKSQIEYLKDFLRR